MKKFFYLLSAWIVLSGPLAYGEAPWGALADFDQPLLPNQQPVQLGERYLLPQILRGEPVRIFIDVAGASENQQESYQTMIADNYNEWFTRTARLIEQSKREQEFADILVLLKKGVAVEFVSELYTADVVIRIRPFSEVRRWCGLSAAGCYRRVQMARNVHEIWLPKDQFLLKVFSRGKVSTSRIGLHEIGHSLGLSDQYEQAIDSTSHPRYASARSGKAIMNEANKITCDDADGLINLIDLVRGTARGGEEGWKSLCPKSEDYYVRGQSMLRGNYVISTPDKEIFNLSTYEKGKKVSTQSFSLADQHQFVPLLAVRETVLQRDPLGRAVLAKGELGETIYYSYRFESSIRLAVKDGRALWAEVNYFDWSQKKKMTGKIYYFKRDGVLTTAGLAFSKRKNGYCYYVETPTPNRNTLEMSFDIDKRGVVTNEFLESTFAANSRAQQPKGISAQASPSDRRAEAIAQEVGQQMQINRREKIKQQLIVWFNQQISPPKK